MIIGATAKVAELTDLRTKIPKNRMLRIFPNSDGLPPSWTDPRFEYCRVNGVTPFISFKSTDFNAVRAWLLSAPTWLRELYSTYHHEPEGDMADTTFRPNFVSSMDMVNGLPAALRSKIKHGPALTKQWTENTAGRDYSTYDPGVGDFWGVDAYHNSWASGYANPVTWLQRIKAYDTSGRPKMLPELGSVSLPSDADDSGRAAWIDGVFAELETFPNLLGAIWWNTQGSSGGAIEGLGTTRWFQLDRKSTGNDGNWRLLSPAPSLAAFNAIVDRHQPVVAPDCTAEYDRGYTDGFTAGRAQGNTEGLAAGRVLGRQQYRDEFEALLPPV